MAVLTSLYDLLNNAFRVVRVFRGQLRFCECSLIAQSPMLIGLEPRSRVPKLGHNVRIALNPDF